MIFTPEMDLRIRQLYTPPYIRGQVAQQARQWKCGTSDIVRRRNQLEIPSLITPKPRKTWTQQEIIIVKENPHLSNNELRIALQRNGYERKQSAVQSFRLRSGWRSKLERDEISVGYTAQELAQIMGVQNKTVLRWIKSGELKARAEGGIQRCGCWRIKPSAVKQFMINYVHRWNPGSIDKFWLVETLTS
jgi:excisionase family DNA binding protein